MLRELKNKYYKELKEGGVKTPNNLEGISLILLTEILEVLKNIEKNIVKDEITSINVEPLIEEIIEDTESPIEEIKKPNAKK